MIEVFASINNHMLKGIMFHAQLADYFDFLNLHGLKRCQEYHFLLECSEMRGIHRYALNHINKLIMDFPVEDPQVIPTNWKNYTRMQVDNNTRKSAVKEAFEKWFEWESLTKNFYEQQFKILTENSKIAEANKVNQLICGVDQELKDVIRKMLEYKSVDYSLDYILYQQNELHEKYEEKTKNIGIDIC